MESSLLRLALRALSFTSLALPALAQFTPFCPGDGSQLACPCGNNGATARGCANSVFTNGALLSGTGGGCVGFCDDVVLTASSLTGSTCIFFQGDAQMAPMIIDDGLGCVIGNVIRLGNKTISGGAASYPSAGDPPISVQTSIPPGGTLRYYQCYYRNADAVFCPPATSNRTNGLIIQWHGPA